MARRRTAYLLAATALLAALTPTLDAANHREAPITALDHKADITDVYAFMSYGPGGAGKVTLIMGVDPLLEPANGPNWFPFDDEILYELKVDNNNDAREDITFQFRFETEQRLPLALSGLRGHRSSGAVAPSNSPAPVAPGTLDRAAADHQLRFARSRSAAALLGDARSAGTSSSTCSRRTARPLYAVPTNVGPRTMDYEALFNQGIYNLPSGIKVFAGTTDDAFWIDLGGAFDTFNLRSSVAPGVLSAAQDAANENFAADTVSGYAVNTLAIEIPVTLLTRTGRVEPATSPAATIGVWGNDVAPARVRAPQHQRRAGSIGPVPPGAAHGQPAHQRADHRHRLEGSLQHGPAGERRPVRQLLRRSRRCRAC